MYDTYPARIPCILAIGVFVAVLGVDVATKAWAAASLMEPVRIADWLYLMLHRNSGMFFGTVSVSVGYWICVCAAAGWFGRRALRSTSVRPAVCLAVTLAGLTGNAIGQAQGAVVDFIGVGPITGDVWLVGNVADLALVGGVLALGICLVRKRDRRAESSPSGAASLPPIVDTGSRRSPPPLRRTWWDLTRRCGDRPLGRRCG